MRKGELECVHGIGHSANNHGCDGCCFVLGVYERERIISLLEREPSLNGFTFRDSGVALSAHLVALIKGENK